MARSFTKKDARDNLLSKLLEMRIRGYTTVDLESDSVQVFTDKRYVGLVTIGELLDRLLD